MTSPYQRNKAPRPKQKIHDDIPLWQWVIGGLFIAVGGMLAGGMIAEIVLPIVLPGLLR